MKIVSYCVSVQEELYYLFKQSIFISDGQRLRHIVASQYGHTDIVSLLLKANANPNCQMDDGSTPLLYASQQGHSGICQSDLAD